MSWASMNKHTVHTKLAGIKTVNPRGGTAFIAVGPVKDTLGNLLTGR